MPLADSTTSPQTGRAKMTRSEAARHAANVRYGKEQPFAARLAAIREARKQRKAKGGKGKATPEQRDAKKRSEQTANVNTIGDTLDAADMLAGADAYDNGGEVDPKIQKDMVAAGLGEVGKDGSFRLTSTGREALASARRGDIGAARDALSRGRDNVATGAERAAAGAARDKARTDKQAEREKAQADKVAARAAKEKQAAKEKAKSGGGGGGKGDKERPSPKTAADRDVERAQQRGDNRATVQQRLEQSAGTSLNSAAFDALASFADGDDADPGTLAALADHTGLVERDSGGGYRMTSEGRAYVSAADKGNVRAAGDAMSRAMDKVKGAADRATQGAADEAQRAEDDANAEADAAVRADRLKFRKKRQTWKAMAEALDSAGGYLVAWRRRKRRRARQRMDEAKAQTAQERAMFANMGSSGGGGGKGGGKKPTGGQGGLWPKGADGQRHPPGGGGGAAGKEDALPEAHSEADVARLRKGDYRKEDFDRISKGELRKGDYVHDASNKLNHGEVTGVGTVGRQQFVRVKNPKGEDSIIHPNDARISGVHVEHGPITNVAGTAIKPAPKADSAPKGGGAAPKSKPASGLSKDERAALRNIPESGKQKPDQGEIFRNGIAASYDGIDPASGRTYQVGMGAGNVLRGADGNYYAQAHGTVHQVTNVRPARLSTRQQNNLGGGRDAFKKDLDMPLSDIADTLTDAADALAELGDDAIKAGARHSGGDMAIIQQIFEAANELEELAIALGADPGDDEDEEDEPEETEEGGAVEMKDIEIFSTFGGAIKALDGDGIGGYAVLFGAPDMHDLSAQRDYFDRNTDFWLKRFGWPRPITYHHGLDPDTADDPIVGEWKSARVDNVGVWLEGQLDKAHKYHGAVKELIRRGYLKLSSDSAPQWVQRERDMDTGANYVKRWPLITASTTVTPAEPRMAALSLKALMADLGLSDIDDNPQANDLDSDRHDGAKADDDRARRLLLEIDILALETAQ